mmetsp:Transcript_1750/g.3800  ORF Transcript_1750/g.3800 Transcript_1750/m.3800 type:complete len:216 (-) Transcript_1750:390-1037(-)
MVFAVGPHCDVLFDAAVWDVRVDRISTIRYWCYGGGYAVRSLEDLYERREVHGESGRGVREDAGCCGLSAAPVRSPEHEGPAVHARAGEALGGCESGPGEHGEVVVGCWAGAGCCSASRYHVCPATSLQSRCTVRRADDHQGVANPSGSSGADERPSRRHPHERFRTSGAGNSARRRRWKCSSTPRCPLFDAPGSCNWLGIDGGNSGGGACSHWS